MSAALWWLGQNTFTVALLVPLVHGACRIYRYRPAVQHVLWLVVLVKFITPPIVSWPWTVEPLRELIRPVRSLAPASVLGATKLVEGLPGPEIENDALTGGFGKASAAGWGERGRWEIAEIAGWMAMAGWLLGAAVSLTWQIRRIVRHACLLRRGTAASEQLMEEVRKSAQRMRLRPPRVVVVRGILSPFMWFVGRLRLVWPEAMSSRAAIVRARSIIAHELAHVRRGDHWMAWLELAAGIVWWWNPLFWLVRRRLRETGEMACDALAIGTYPENRREYAELLLELSAGIQTGAPAPVLAVSAGTPSSFERRLSMILSDRVSGKLSSWGILAAVCLGLVALPGWSLGHEQKKPEAGEFETRRKALLEEFPAACREGIAKNGSAAVNVCMKCHGYLTGIAGVAYTESCASCHATEPVHSYSENWKYPPHSYGGNRKHSDEQSAANTREDYGSDSGNKPAAPAVDAGMRNLEQEKARLQEIIRQHQEIIRKQHSLEQEKARLQKMVRQQDSLEREKARLQELLRQQTGSMAEDLRKAALEEKREAEEEYKRSLKLFEARFITQQQLDAAKARVERALAGLNFGGAIPQQGRPIPKETPEARWEILRLQHAKAADVSRLLNELLSMNEISRLRIIADERTNCILLRGRATDVEAIKEILTRLDKLAATATRRPDKGH